MGPTNGVLYLVDHLSAVLSKQADHLLQDQVGIGMSQYKVLMILEWNPRVQQRIIAKSLGQTEASISRQIKLLTGKGLLNAKQDPANKRKHITAPTPKGMQVTEAANDILRRNFGAAFSSLNDEQATQLITGLTNLHATICKPGKIGACDHPLGL